MAFELTIGDPQPGQLLVIGETTEVGGFATGRGGAEPILVDSVVVQVGDGSPVLAELTLGGGLYKASVVVPGPPGPIEVSVTARYDSGLHQSKSVVATAAAGSLSGVWSSDDGMLFYLSQNGNALWWVGMDQGPGLQGAGLEVTTVFFALINSVTIGDPGENRPEIGIPPPDRLGIQGVWTDVPRGVRSLNGSLTLQPESGPDGAQFLNVTAEVGGFTATRLTKIAYVPPQLEDIQAILNVVHKNLSDSEVLGGGNLTAYKDPVVLFGAITPGGSGMTVGRRPTDGLTFADFICLHAGGNLDGDLTMDLTLDRSRLDGGGPFGQPNFWTEGWETNLDPQAILGKVNDGAGHLHLECIMYGRNASCGQTDNYGDPALMPGWQDAGGDSVLINGRPLDGALQMQPIPGQDPPPLAVSTLAGWSIGPGTLVRVTGALVLDCGHFRFWHPFDSCGAGDPSFQNQEIHPVYAIDVINATPSTVLSGVWSDNLGMTYYVSQVGDTVWWFGMGPFRNNAFAQVFQGELVGDLISGTWQDVPLGPGVSGEQLQLATDSAKLTLTPTASASLANLRWTKLYD